MAVHLHWQREIWDKQNLYGLAHFIGWCKVGHISRNIKQHFACNSLSSTLRFPCIHHTRTYRKSSARVPQLAFMPGVPLGPFVLSIRHFRLGTPALDYARVLGGRTWCPIRQRQSSDPSLQQKLCFKGPLGPNRHILRRPAWRMAMLCPVPYHNRDNSISAHH